VAYPVLFRVLSSQKSLRRTSSASTNLNAVTFSVSVPRASWCRRQNQRLALPSYTFPWLSKQHNTPFLQHTQEESITIYLRVIKHVALFLFFTRGSFDFILVFG
jgi:hypothetical protein